MEFLDKIMLDNTINLLQDTKLVKEIIKREEQYNKYKEKVDKVNNYIINKLNLPFYINLNKDLKLSLNKVCCIEYYQKIFINKGKQEVKENNRCITLRRLFTNKYFQREDNDYKIVTIDAVNKMDLKIAHATEYTNNSFDL